MYAGIFGDLFKHLDSWSSHTWFLAVIFGIAYLDSVIPIVPSETCVIIGGVACATGGASYGLWAVIASGAAGANGGDCPSSSAWTGVASKIRIPRCWAMAAKASTVR